ncbi:MAG: hypothetical protein INR71_00125 [Terriglobus roseus]|nr:hypothetical protein [Terriglobus roseus]
MKELDFQDCKIRVTNVDSQESGADIVIQVIGEISNKSAPHRKFVQTFVLARQTNGFFVLTDIFRYIAEEEEELEDQAETQGQAAAPTGYQEPAATAEEKEPKGLTSSDNTAEQEHDAHLVGEELEKVAEEDSRPSAVAAPAQVNGTAVPKAVPIAVAEDAPAAAVGAPAESADATANATADLQPEKPEDPKASPATTPAAPAGAPSAPKASAPTKPAAPKTWASLAASANRSAPPAATPAVSTPAQPQQKTSAPSAAAPAVSGPTAPAAAAQTPARDSPDTDGQQSDGWQAVGGGHDRKQSRAQGQVGTETPRFRAYIKNVFANVDADALKAQLTKYGEVSYFDVSRQKVSDFAATWKKSTSDTSQNCAFVDFATQAGFQAAVNANPHKIGNEEVFVEERRERPFQFQPRGGMRGGRGGPEQRPGQGRGGFNKDAGRGGFQPRGRGGNTTPRGRGTPQVA